MSSEGGDKKKPDQKLWDFLYVNKKDVWTMEEADDVFTEFYKELTQGKANQNILVPLCGRSKVMITLADQGHNIVGIEWSKVAVEMFFEENELSYVKSVYNLDGKEAPLYKAKEKAIAIYCADIFAFKDHQGFGPFDCILDHGSIGSFDTSRTIYATLMSPFTKPGGRVLMSIFDYDHSEHPSIPFAVTEEEVNSLFKEDFKSITLVKELDAQRTADIFAMHDPDCIFPVLTLSRMSWKVLLMVKK